MNGFLWIMRFSLGGDTKRDLYDNDNEKWYYIRANCFRLMPVEISIIVILIKQKKIHLQDFKSFVTVNYSLIIQYLLSNVQTLCLSRRFMLFVIVIGKMTDAIKLRLTFAQQNFVAH